MLAADASKVVLVTGCSQGGLGAALCEEYAKRGCIVYATARNVKAMEFTHPDIHVLKLDVVDEEEVQSVVKTIVDDEGRIDILVNNAGAACAGALVDTPVDAMKNIFETNTFSIMRMVQAVFPHMAARRSGEIVNIGSISGEIPIAWNGVYSSSKAAVRGLSDVLWMEFKPFNIAVTHVSAGSVHSNLAKKALGSGVHMPADSLYRPYAAQITTRILAGKPPDSLPAAEFARRVAGASLAPRPPRYMTLGKMSALWWLLSWLPRTWVLNRVWNGVQKMAAPTAAQNGRSLD